MNVGHALLIAPIAVKAIELGLHQHDKNRRTMSAGPVIVINLLAILFVGVLLRGSDWHYGMGEATSA